MADAGATLATFREHVHELSDRFTRQSARYRGPAYNEETARSEFISPFFEALGWDLANRQGNALQYRDVIHEEGIKVGDATKAPDYTFRIGGQRKFFVEAKKPGVDLKVDTAPAYQLRRYAWSAKLPLSILTDFEELAVYDTRIRPEEKDKASAARVLYFRHEEYESRAEEIWSVFAKRAVLEGRFDTYAEENLKKRGTSEVDGEFLKEIERWREELAKNLALRNPGLTVDELNYAVQATIDRILFLRIAEGRGAELYGRLLALTNGSEIYRRLTALYREADERYNSGIFDFKADKLTLTLALDDKVIRPLLKALYYPESPYEFSVLPAEILGNVYEQFLGKVIRLTPAGRAKVEEKPEVKKAGGVYYTPSYIVDYIVGNTVGKLLEGRSPKEMAKLRVVDPACGSGSFLLSAYQKLLDAHLAWYREHEPKKHKEAVFEGPGSDWRLTTAKKREVLLNSIFGVDIDRQAVEVTKLSLLLKCLEGETNESLRQLTLYGERALPSLDKNIQCGNSLISPDALLRHTGGLFPDEDELRRINPFDWQKSFPEVFKSGGFDVVIGNPPWGADFSNREKTLLDSDYRLNSGKYESYIFFFERAATLLKENGAFGFITPSFWISRTQTGALRDFLLHFLRPARFLVLPENVFTGVKMDSCILTASKSSRSTIARVAEVKSEQLGAAPTAATLEALEREVSLAAWEATPSLRFNPRISDADVPVLSKLALGSQPLGRYVEITQGLTLYRRSSLVQMFGSRRAEEIVVNREFHATFKRNKTFKRELLGRDVKRFAVTWNGESWVSYGPWLAHAVDERFFRGPRLVVQKIRNPMLRQRLVAGYTDDDEAYSAGVLLNLIPRPQVSVSLHSILALLNSRLINFWYRLTILDVSIRVADLSQVPIREPSTRISSQLDTLAKRMCELAMNEARAKTSHDLEAIRRQFQAADTEIDRLVYELYELTPQEIAIVEKG